MPEREFDGERSGLHADKATAQECLNSGGRSTISQRVRLPGHGAKGQRAAAVA